MPSPLLQHHRFAVSPLSGLFGFISMQLWLHDVLVAMQEVPTSKKKQDTKAAHQRPVRVKHMPWALFLVDLHPCFGKKIYASISSIFVEGLW
jgi:hypothetical protein